MVLKGRELNTRATGTRVTIYSNEQKQVSEQFPTRGFMSAVTDVMHFGLGSAKIIDSVIVRWPDLSEQILKNIPADTIITLTITDAKKPQVTERKKIEDIKLFRKTIIPGLEYRHIEDKYTDFHREKLIPHNLSEEGPTVAAGDVNGDGLEDLFIGGAKGQPAEIFVQNKNGSFRKLELPVLTKERFAEDVDAVFFDSDGDGDQDLYIVRGGNEYPEGDPFLSDLLLINNKGEFSRSEKGTLPYLAFNGSCVRPADFDNDGDMDLFIGSRSVPGAYGLSPQQFLLENDGSGKFSNVTKKRINEIEYSGMVTDAQWVDYDNDGDKDLIVTGEWMKIMVYRNENGYFKDVTFSAGLDNTSGWWYCLHACDIDMDGDLDLIGGNLGLNSILKASVREPVVMYLNDFDNNGSPDPIISYYQDGLSYPFAPFDELADQINVLRTLFPNYSDFGGKTVQVIFGRDILEHSITKKAELFESCLFVNNGNGTFSIVRLPIEAQFAPVRSFVVDDFNKDGISDIAIAGNNYSVRPSYGRYDATYGWCLLGAEDYSFKSLMPSKSGLIIKGDARKVLKVEISGKHYLIALINDGTMQIFEF